MSGPAPSFEEHFAREIVVAERMRASVLAVVLAALLAFGGLMSVLFRSTYQQIFSGPSALVHFSLIIGALFAYELLIRHNTGRWLQQGRSVPLALRYLNALVETSVPTLLMLAAAKVANPLYVLQGPAALLYAVFIVLSVMRLDARLSVFTGLVAAAEYLALCIHFAGRDLAPGTPFDELAFFFPKVVMLLLSGLAAGFVAHQVKRRVGNAWRAQQERQRLMEAFGQQVSPAIVEELMKAGGAIASRRGTVCVLFMDIRNFTPLVEHKAPEEIVAFQNAVFGEAIEVVNRNHGIINQFLGDGFMSTFGAPVSAGNDARNALNAARELVAGIRVLCEKGRIPSITVGIGLHIGEAVHGNVGSELRQQYSVTGNVVIIASRIEQLNKKYGSQALVTREVLEAAGAHGLAPVALGAVQVKGHEQPIELFRIA
jgi:adenylate cyclase